MAAYLSDFESARTIYEGQAQPMVQKLSTEYVSGLHAQITALQVELRHAKQQAAESARATQYLLHIQAATLAVPALARVDTDMPGLRERNQQLELETTSLRDQVNYLANVLSKESCNSARPATCNFEHHALTQKPHGSMPPRMPVHEHGHNRRPPVSQMPLRPQDALPVQGQGNLGPSPMPKIGEPIEANIIHDEHAVLIDFGDSEEVTHAAPNDIQLQPVADSNILNKSTSVGGMQMPIELGIPSHNLQESVSFTSMMEGAKEWAEDTPKPVTTERKPAGPMDQLHVLNLDPPAQNFCPQNRKADSTTGLQGSRYCPPRNAPTEPARMRRTIPTRSQNPYWHDKVQFQPRPGTSPVYQRVLISNLPDNITYPQLLPQICGGQVVSCEIADTKKLTGSMTGLIRFLHESSARAFTKHAAKYPLSFRDSADVDNTAVTRATVELVETHSYPLNARLVSRIFQHGHTRVLEVGNFPYLHFPGHTPADLMVYLRPMNGCTMDRVERIEVLGDDRLLIAFTSVEAAANAVGKFTGNPTYRKCDVSFVADPCDRPCGPVEDEAMRGEGERGSEDKRVERKAEKLNPDEIDLELESVKNAEKDLDGGSAVSSGVDIGLVTPPESASEDESKRLEKFNWAQRKFVPARWDKARERALELAALRQSGAHSSLI